MLLRRSSVCAVCAAESFKAQKSCVEKKHRRSVCLERSKFEKRHKIKMGTTRGARWGGAGLELGVHPVSSGTRHPLMGAKKERLTKVRDEQALLDMREHQKHSSSGIVRQIGFLVDMSSACMKRVELL